MAFLSRISDEGNDLPKFVVRELEGYLRCGILEHGFTRLACRDCKHEMLVALSCKGRGFCPSCTSRRMSEVAWHLEREVIGRVPTRQYVCSLPWKWRLRAGYDGKVCSALLHAAAAISSSGLLPASRPSLKGSPNSTTSSMKCFCWFTFTGNTPR